jgi:hypothetical protein
LQVIGFDAAEVAFDAGEILVGFHDLGRVKWLFVNGGAPVVGGYPRLGAVSFR